MKQNLAKFTSISDTSGGQDHEVNGVPHITAVKSALPLADGALTPVVKTGDVITYNIDVTNDGDGNAYAVLTYDAIPEGTTYVTGSATMASRNGSDRFDFSGVYTEVIPEKSIAYSLGDSRKVHVTFTVQGNAVIVKETFDPEQANAADLQRAGWQAILDNFKRYVEKTEVP